ncbi:MAG TPA: Trp family transcriptional regulator [Ignavibacteriales bacterium]|nr:Trp family transcriptional regulator [Ignavibacteriales bacterium]HOL81344.1 Trp family transcriptional regulator [Ignavibacteriales bacterium]HOM65460.1 Trp family transcriptional regulator [Ignavibacteriales bacterium]HPD68282.1 Trp family transcriptional regulator [Ignavibacteriales bacterium]HPP33887.1 Trp family transcriptional regulator [Ignavibacteriales bacterium]
MQELNELLEAILLIKSKKELEDFFKEILTEAEIKDITKRWCLMRDILLGESQRNISKKYGISLCKITRGSKILKKENSISKKLLLNIYKELKNGNS